MENKLAIIGCGDISVLRTILDCFGKPGGCPANIVTASRPEELINLARALNPGLIILAFNGHSQLLREIDTKVNNPELPVLCLSGRQEGDTLGWDTKCIVFTYPLAQISNGSFLSSKINSILALRQHPAPVAAAITTGEHGRSLSRYVMELDRKVDTLHKVKHRIAHLYPSVAGPLRDELTSIANSIRVGINDKKLWDDFKFYFEESNPRFLANISRQFPALTPIDLKYCCYLVMNMSNDDIRALLGINQESVRTHKYRLKRKMSLSKSDDLTHYLRSVG